MKSTIITIAFIVLSFISNSQVFTLEFMLCQNFEHPSNVSTPFAKQLDVINYTGCHKSDTVIKLVFDITNKKCEFKGKVYPIVDVFSFTDSTFEFIIQCDNESFACVLSGSIEGDFVYISEKVDGEKVVGWFTLNPKVIKTL